MKNSLLPAEDTSSIFTLLLAKYISKYLVIVKHALVYQVLTIL